MTTTSRQNNLLLNQDWKRIYQTFKTADFKSYDFENLRRVIISYLRENYPEDFNDYIESSEYLALIDAIAFVGQSLSFRLDLASRENFIELAETKESVLRLARLLSYNSKRNLAAEGILKFDTITTTENIYDSNGKNLAQQVIIWNDPTNPNWFEQFVLILNSAMSDSVEFGRSEGSGVIQGIQSDQYRFRSRFTDVPIFNFEKTVANRRSAFELVSTSFKNSNKFYEEPPLPGRQLGFIYRQDGKGPGSSNTGFFLLLKQGSLEVTDFSIEVPTTNEKVSIDVANINDNDVWLFSLDNNGNQTDEWTKVPSLYGNNIAYNSVRADQRNVYNVVTKEQDKIDLVFADGVYGNLPKGSFRSYYRVSNGREYSITPAEMRGINISVPFFNKEGVAHELTISCGLKYTISNSARSEDIDSIRLRAPAIYYTQNRMITGEDYNLAPLASSQDILKVKAINRTSSGISRNFDIIDASGKYSSVNVFGSDGLIYREETEKVLAFKYTNRSEAINFVRDRIEPLLNSVEIYNYYLTKFEKIVFTDSTVRWNNVTADVNQSTGYFFSSVDNSPIRVGNYTNNALRYVLSGALIKFVPPPGMKFRLGQLVDEDPLDSLQTSSIWTKAVKITGDGTNAGRGALASGLGPIVFNDIVPTGAIASRIVPRLITNLPVPFELEMVNLITSDLNFGLRYDVPTSTWKIISSSNLNLTSFFSVGTTGDVSNINLDSSWLVAFVKDVEGYKVRFRGLDYIFSSLEQTRFYFDANQKTYDSNTGKVVKDNVTVLGINTDSGLVSPLKKDISFEVSNSIDSEDGYSSAKEIKIAFSDSDDDGVIDNPEAFDEIISPVADFRFLFFKKVVDGSGNIQYDYIENKNNSVIKVAQTQNSVLINSYNDNDLVYFYVESEDRVMKVVNNGTSKVFEYQSDYKAVVGRSDLKFQYVHNANVDRRIDPSVSNIVDVYLLTRNYDTAFRNYLSGATTIKPQAPTSETLKIAYGSGLDLIKSISDEIIYYPVGYKILFGADAAPELQVSFKVVKNPSKTIDDNELKVRIINAINLFFDVNNWDFGDRFYLGELITYITNEVSPDISNLVIVPRQPTQVFGSLFEIQSGPEEIFISGATVDDVEIVSAITATQIRASAESVITST